MRQDAQGRFVVGMTVVKDPDHAVWGLLRLNKHGRPDRTFGRRGATTLAIGPGHFEDAVVALPQADGTTLVAGSVEDAQDTDNGMNSVNQGSTSMGVARVSAAGTLQGKAEVHMAGIDYPIWALPRAGGLLIGGSSSLPNANYACLLAVDGGLAQDAGFRNGCLLPPGSPRGTAEFRDARPDGDGTVLAVDGYTVNDDGSHVDAFGIGRVGADGQPDPAFGTDGFTFTDFGVAHADEIYGARAIARRGGGGWVVGGTGPDGFAFAGFTASGELDPSFGSGGKVAIDADAKTRETLRVMREEPDGSVLVAGTGTNGNILVLKLRADGSLDPAFGKGGKVKLTMKPLIGYGKLRGVEDMVLQGTKALITGPALVYDYNARKYRNQGILLRLKSNGALDRSFGR